MSMSICFVDLSEITMAVRSFIGGLGIGGKGDSGLLEMVSMGLSFRAANESDRAGRRFI